MDIREYLLEVYEEKYGPHINKDLAEALVIDMAVTDGSSRQDGEKFTMTEAKEWGSKVGMTFDTIPVCEFYLVLNAMYSDHYRTGKKHGLTEPLFYAELAYDWFHDADASDDKTFNYFMY